MPKSKVLVFVFGFVIIAWGIYLGTWTLKDHASQGVVEAGLDGVHYVHSECKPGCFGLQGL